MTAKQSPDYLLCKEYIRQIRENTVERKCMLCGRSFKTDQAYRLCEDHRNGDVEAPIYLSVPRDRT